MIVLRLFVNRTINGGKSKWNEDQSRAGTFFLRAVDCNSNQSGVLLDSNNEELDIMVGTFIQRCPVKLTHCLNKVVY